MIHKRLRNPHRAHGIDIKYLRPGIVIDVSNRLSPSSADGGIVDDKINGLPLQFVGSRLDTGQVSDT